MVPPLPGSLNEIVAPSCLLNDRTRRNPSPDGREVSKSFEKPIPSSRTVTVYSPSETWP